MFVYRPLYSEDDRRRKIAKLLVINKIIYNGTRKWKSGVCVNINTCKKRIFVNLFHLKAERLITYSFISCAFFIFIIFM